MAPGPDLGGFESKAKGFLRSGRLRDEAAAALARGEAEPRPPAALPA